MSRMSNPVGCCAPIATAPNTYYVKMDTDHNPSYYLVNRTSIEDDRVSLQADLDDVGAIYFSSEHSAQYAINSYILFWQERGVKVKGEYKPVGGTVAESQVMEFI